MTVGRMTGRLIVAVVAMAVLGAAAVMLTSACSGPGAADARTVVFQEDIMNACTCRVEPQVKSDFAVPDILRGHDVEEMHVLIFADGFENRFWFMCVPEQIWINHRKHHYQIGMDWQSTADGWSYDGCPVRNLLGYWDTSGPKVILKAYSENECPIVGYQAATIRSDQTGVHYEVRVTNRSRTIWRDVYTHICFNSFRSPATGYRPYVRLGDKWLPFQDVPSAGAYCTQPVEGMIDEYNRTHMKDDQPVGMGVSFPGVVAWNLVAGEPLLTCHYSTDAVAVWSNQEWPCTDIYLWFGRIEPGQEVSRAGHVYIAKSDIASFSEEAERLLQ